MEQTLAKAYRLHKGQLLVRCRSRWYVPACQIASHLDADSRDVIKLVMGLVCTMAALILGLLTASANSSYDAQSNALQSLSANIVVLAKLRRAGKGKHLVIENGAEAEVNEGLVELIKEAFVIRNQLLSGSGHPARTIRASGGRGERLTA